MEKLIKMTACAAGPECNLAEGKVYEIGHHLTKAFAKALIAGGYAEEYEELAVEPDEGETAAIAAEKPQKKKGSKKKATKKKAAKS